jgi:hypothetical protein
MTRTEIIREAIQFDREDGVESIRDQRGWVASLIGSILYAKAIIGSSHAECCSSRDQKL